MKTASQQEHSAENSRIVSDGQWRIRVDAAFIAKVRVEVEREYEQEIREVKTGWQRWKLHWKIEREISRRLKERHVRI